MGSASRSNVTAEAQRMLRIFQRTPRLGGTSCFAKRNPFAFPAKREKKITVYCLLRTKESFYLHFMKTLLTIVLLAIGFTAFAQTETALLNQGDSLFKINKTKEAIDTYTKLITKNPKHEKARFARALAYQQLEKNDLAAIDYKEALKKNPACAKCFMRLGELSMRKNDTVTALSYAQKAQITDTNFYGGYLLKARIAELKEQNDEASAYYDKAVLKGDSIADTYYFRGDFRGHRNNYDKALTDFAKTVALNPNAHEAYFKMGLIYASQQKWNEALDQFKLAIQYDSSNSYYYSSAGGVCLYLLDNAGAYRYYNRALQLDDKNYEALYYRSQASYRMEDMDASCTGLQALLKKLPADPKEENQKQLREMVVEDINNHCDSSLASYFYQRGIACYNLRKYDHAIQWYDRGMAKFPNHCMMTSFRGNAYLAAGDFRAAEADYSRSIELRPNLIAELQKGRTRNNEALVLRDYASYIIADIYRMRSHAKLSMNNYAGAMADIDEGIAMVDPKSEERADFFKSKADVFLAQNDNSSAFTWYNKALQVQPDFPEALANRALVKLNLAYRVRVISPSIGVNSSRINLPAKTQQVVNKDNLESALADCNKAITGNPQYGYAYYVRSMIKEALEQPDYCYDLLKAESLGVSFVKEIIVEKKCR